FINQALEREIKNAGEGIEASVIIKINNLVDKQIIKKLYDAADAGVKVHLIIRGICVLREEKPHKNISAFGVVDRYLEHSRIFVFANGGLPEYFISSADLMPRNLEHRIEVVCPILSSEHKKEIQDILDIQMLDNVKARYLQPYHINDYKTATKDIKHQSQFEIYKYLKKKSEAI
ncbi:MAG: RNA degradosome polyphosphate kinase, partial [Bacteroidales bacterium]|nr:RNA degradosome polyphosphate kinase [Bacteroidales bacterium]